MWWQGAIGWQGSCGLRKEIALLRALRNPCAVRLQIIPSDMSMSIPYRRRRGRWQTCGACWATWQPRWRSWRPLSRRPPPRATPSRPPSRASPAPSCRSAAVPASVAAAAVCMPWHPKQALRSHKVSRNASLGVLLLGLWD